MRCLRDSSDINYILDYSSAAKNKDSKHLYITDIIC